MQVRVIWIQGHRRRVERDEEREAEALRGRAGSGLPQALGFPVCNAIRCILAGNPLYFRKLCVFLHVKPARLENSWYLKRAPTSQMQLPLWTPAVGTTLSVPGTYPDPLGQLWFPVTLTLGHEPNLSP